MTRNNRPRGDAEPRDPTIEGGFSLLMRPAWAPEDFHARTMVKVKQRQARRGLFVWIRRDWGPVWVPALAICLLLSLSLNVLLGYRGVEQTEQFPGMDLLGIRKDPIEQGEWYAAAGEYADALQAYRAGLRANGPSVAQVLRKIAGVQYQLGQYHQAIEAATAALVLNPDDALAYRYRGTAHEAVGDRSQAIPDLQRAARLRDTKAQDTLRSWNIEW